MSSHLCRWYRGQFASPHVSSHVDTLSPSGERDRVRGSARRDRRIREWRARSPSGARSGGAAVAGPDAPGGQPGDERIAVDAQPPGRATLVPVFVLEGAQDIGLLEPVASLLESQ